MKYLYLARAPGLPGRGGQPVPRAGPRPLLGAVERRVGPVRHEDVRPARARCGRAATWPWPTPRCKLLIERGAVDERFVADHTEGCDELVADLAGQDARRPAAPRPASTAASSRRSSTSYAARRRAPSSSGRWASPSTATRSTACGPSSTWRWPGATSAATAPGSCPSAATRACRAAPRWAPTPPRCPAGVAGRRRARRRRSAEQWGFAVPDAPGLTAPEMVEAAERGELDVLWMSGGNFLDVLPDPPRGRGGARRGCRCGSTRTSCSPARCWSTATTSSCCRSPPATSRRAAAPRPPPSAASSSAPRSPARSARPAASGASSPTWPAGSGPTCADAFALADQPGAAGRDRRGRARSTPASRTLADTGDAGAVGRAAPVRRRRVPDAVGPGPVHRR